MWKKTGHKDTPGSNLMWESSRMILPEHADAILAWRQQRNAIQRPQLDEQEWEIINRELIQSQKLRVPIKIKMYDPFEELIVDGVVETIDAQLKRFKVNDDWFRISEIVKIV